MLPSLCLGTSNDGDRKTSQRAFEMNDFQDLVFEIDERVATITLNRPRRLNAATQAMKSELREALEQANDDDSVRAIILTGAGRGFCAGADMTEISDLSESGDLSAGSALPFDMDRRADYQTRFSYFPAVRKPIIAAINGPCIGLGLVYAMYCDIRFASETAVFGTSFSRLGLVAEHGTSWMLPLIVGHAHALDLLLSARQFDAAEALRMNFVTRVSPADDLMPIATAYARDLAENASPRSMKVIKEQVYEAPFQSLAEAVRSANHAMESSFDSEDFKEGIAHFMERRKPRFTGR